MIETNTLQHVAVKAELARVCGQFRAATTEVPELS